MSATCHHAAQAVRLVTDLIPAARERRRRDPVAFVTFAELAIRMRDEVLRPGPPRQQLMADSAAQLIVLLEGDLAERGAR